MDHYGGPQNAGPMGNLANKESLRLRKGVANLRAALAGRVRRQHGGQGGPQSISLGVRYRGPEAKGGGGNEKAACDRHYLTRHKYSRGWNFNNSVTRETAKNPSPREPDMAHFCTQAWRL